MKSNRKWTKKGGGAPKNCPKKKKKEGGNAFGGGRPEDRESQKKRKKPGAILEDPHENKVEAGLEHLGGAQSYWPFPREPPVKRLNRSKMSCRASPKVEKITLQGPCPWAACKRHKNKG